MPDVVPPRDRSLPSAHMSQAVNAAVGSEIAATVRVLTKPPKGIGADSSERQATYMADLRNASYIARVIKIFDRLNNLRCVHKNPTKAPDYLEETERDYLPLAAELGDDLDARIAVQIARAEEALRGESTQESSAHMPKPA